MTECFVGSCGRPAFDSCWPVDVQQGRWLVRVINLKVLWTRSKSRKINRINGETVQTLNNYEDVVPRTAKDTSSDVSFILVSLY